MIVDRFLDGFQQAMESAVTWWLLALTDGKPPACIVCGKRQTTDAILWTATHIHGPGDCVTGYSLVYHCTDCSWEAAKRKLWADAPAELKMAINTQSRHSSDEWRTVTGEHS